MTEQKLVMRIHVHTIKGRLRKIQEPNMTAAAIV